MQRRVPAPILPLVMLVIAYPAFGLPGLHIETSLVGSGQLVQESGYESLLQIGLRPELSINAELSPVVTFGLAFAYSYVFPSSFSPYWYRYKGYDFFALTTSLAYTDPELPITPSIHAGASVARYLYTDSYFFFPTVALRFATRSIVLNKLFSVSVIAAIPYSFRRDVFALGLETGLSIRWGHNFEK